MMLKMLTLTLTFLALGPLAAAWTDTHEAVDVSTTEPVSTPSYVHDADNDSGQILASTPGFAIDWYTIDGGGGISTGSGFHLHGTIGQHDAGVLSAGEPGNGFTLSGGFWVGGATGDGPTDPPPPACPGDLTGSETVGVPDLIVLLGAWGPCPAPCAADLTGSGSVGVPDLIALLGAWGPCP